MKKLSYTGAALLLIVMLGRAQPYTISTFAGGAPPPTPTAALNGVFYRPQGVAVDAIGNVYFSSTAPSLSSDVGTGTSCAYKIDATGTLTRFAGNGRPGYSGDGGAATEAQLVGPLGLALDAGGNLCTLAVDANGDLYITDWYHHVVRKVGSDGIITTIAGNGTRGFSGDGGQASEAQFNSPKGVAVDAAGNVYVADSGNHRVRKIASDGTSNTILDDTANMNDPGAIAFGPNGDLFVTGSNLIQKISSDGHVSAYAKTPSSYVGIAIDASTNLFLTDLSAAQVLELSPSGTLSVVANGTNIPPANDGVPANSFY